jgi:hypothetical protein
MGVLKVDEDDMENWRQDKIEDTYVIVAAKYGGGIRVTEGICWDGKWYIEESGPVSVKVLGWQHFPEWENLENKNIPF